MHIKTLALAAGFASIATIATAADAVLYEPAPQYAAAASQQPFNWTGAYIGIQGGYAWTRIAPPVGTTEDFDGGSLGAHAGFNFQNGNLVYGIEGDVNYNWNERTNAPFGVKAGLDWDGSVRGRVGYAFDRTLIYGTAGLALARGYVEVPGAEYTETLTGWTVGAGLEHAFTDTISARVDYRYSDFGKKDFGLGAGDFAIDQHAVRVGLSYRF